MMAILSSKTQNKTLVSDLRIADSFWTRLRGLLGTKSLDANSGLWIHRCNSIHTFFMQYSIDCVFIDRDMKVVSLVENIKPGRVISPIWGAQSVIELPAGQIKILNLKLGEPLYVGN